MFIKKWWIEVKVESGLEFRGFVNTYSDRKEDFPEMLFGSFSIEKNKEGALGSFSLDSGETPEKNYIIGSIYKPQKTRNKKETEYTLVFDDTNQTSKWSKVEGKLQDHIVLKDTYVTEVHL